MGIAIVSENGNAIARYEGLSLKQALEQAQIDFPPGEGVRRVADWIEQHYSSTKMEAVKAVRVGIPTKLANQKDVEYCPY